MQRLEWRYTRRGIVAHAVALEGCEFSEREAAFCGLGPGRDEYWYGTGAQEEYDYVASLPRCRGCMSRIKT